MGLDQPLGLDLAGLAGEDTTDPVVPSPREPVDLALQLADPGLRLGFSMLDEMP